MLMAIWKNISKGPPVALVLAGLTPMIVAPPARAADYDIGSIHITQPWARATPKGASSGAAYMTITNNGNTPDRVSCVSSDARASRRTRASIRFCVAGTAHCTTADLTCDTYSCKRRE